MLRSVLGNVFAPFFVEKHLTEDHELTPFFLGRISRRVSPKDYSLIFSHLNVSLTQIEKTELECRSIPDDLILSLLLKWYDSSNNKNKATYQALEEAFKKEHTYFTFNIDEVGIMIKVYSVFETVIHDKFV